MAVEHYNLNSSPSPTLRKAQAVSKLSDIRGIIVINKATSVIVNNNNN